MSTDLLLECAIETAKKAGTHALENIGRRSEVIQTSAHDVKLALDVECQKIAEEHIRSVFPTHAILGEESEQRTEDGGQRTEDGYLWIIDPIDGTVNFSHGFMFWCCSVALQKGNQTVAAAVYAPALDQLFSASVDDPAKLNGQAISVSHVDKLEKAMIMTGMDRHQVPGHEPYQTFRTIADTVQKARISGSAALDLCMVASGQADGYFESDIYLWDVAAAGFIIQRAGGIAEVSRELDLPYQMQYIASNGLLHDGLKELLSIGA